jgi:hypothetical protein
MQSRRRDNRRKDYSQEEDILAMETWKTKPVNESKKERR